MLRGRFAGRGAPAALAAAAAFFAIVVVVPPLYGQFLPQRLQDYLIFGLPALAVALIAGHARLLNIGVGATFGVSAYTVAILTQHSELNPLVLAVAALAAGVLVSLLFAIYAVVATGLEYLLLTLLTTSAFASLPLLDTALTGGENGLAVKGAVTISFGLDPLQGNGFYWLVCGVVIFWCALSWYLLSSRAGRAMVAIGRNPARAAAMGYSVHGYQVAVTLYSGAIAASGGWLYALYSPLVFQDLLGLADSVNSVLYSLIGGVDSVIGPLLGTAGLRFLIQYLGQQSTQSQLYVGFALLIVVYLLPTGVVGGLRQLWQLRLRIRSAAGRDLDDVVHTGAAAEVDALFAGTADE
ncbi:MAG TPA: branched-chain amino acid ABC transporter permease [Candidatus Dormibacteraeota bacterium]|nr:branched-chain amino acid ABC transporter permease [Candidatus Dormibacteraeota bacterium]